MNTYIISIHRINIFLLFRYFFSLTHTHIPTRIRYTCICMYVCMCVCIYVFIPFCKITCETDAKWNGIFRENEYRSKMSLRHSFSARKTHPLLLQEFSIFRYFRQPSREERWGKEREKEREEEAR